MAVQLKDLKRSLDATLNPVDPGSPKQFQKMQAGKDIDAAITQAFADQPATLSRPLEKDDWGWTEKKTPTYELTAKGTLRGDPIEMFKVLQGKVRDLQTQNANILELHHEVTGSNSMRFTLRFDVSEVQASRAE
jgi:hypothetical protein